MHSLFPIFEGLGFKLDECFDFFYMPHRCNERGLCSNFGYMFLNCTSPEVAEAFSQVIKFHPLGRNYDTCDRVYCSVANVQGVQENVKAKSGNVKNFMLVRQAGEWQAVQ